jgi:exo-beta-1,3-glucanase (GH17 family)
MANVHPWFGNVSIEDAAAWTYTFFETTDVVAAQALPNNPTMYIAETGWPSVRNRPPVGC